MAGFCLLVELHPEGSAKPANMDCLHYCCMSEVSVCDPIFRLVDVTPQAALEDIPKPAYQEELCAVHMLLITEGYQNFGRISENYFSLNAP